MAAASWGTFQDTWRVHSWRRYYFKRRSHWTLPYDISLHSNWLTLCLVPFLQLYFFHTDPTCSTDVWILKSSSVCQSTWGTHSPFEKNQCIKFPSHHSFQSKWPLAQSETWQQLYPSFGKLCLQVQYFTHLFRRFRPPTEDFFSNASIQPLYSPRMCIVSYP